MMRFQLAISKTFCPTPITTHPKTTEALQKNKNEQNNAFFLPFIGFPHKVHNIRIEKLIDKNWEENSNGNWSRAISIGAVN